MTRYIVTADQLPVTKRIANSERRELTLSTIVTFFSDVSGRIGTVSRPSRLTGGLSTPVRTLTRPMTGCSTRNQNQRRETTDDEDETNVRDTCSILPSLAERHRRLAELEVEFEERRDRSTRQNIRIARLAVSDRRRRSFLCSVLCVDRVSSARGAREEGGGRRRNDEPSFVTRR